MTVLPFEQPDSRPTVLTPAQVHKILIKAAMFDGRGGEDGPAKVDIANWHEAAVLQRWTSLPLAIAAVVDYYSRPAKQGERLWLMPGHVTEYLRAQGRQPAPFAEQQRELTGPPPVADEQRAAHVRKIAAMLARRKSIPEPSPRELADEAAAAKAAAEEAHRARWAAVDACAGCDEGGMRVDAPNVVCDHRPAVSTGKSGLGEDGGPAVDHEVAS